MRTTRNVIDNHLQTFGERDLEGILSDYAPDAIFFTAEGPLHGIASIRELLRAMMGEFAKPGAKFRLDRLSVDGEYGYIAWAAETADNVYELATDTFVVRDGRIAVQSFAAKKVPKLPEPEVIAVA